MQQKDISHAKMSDAELKVDEQDSMRTTKLGETHYASTHMEEKDGTHIAKREVEASVCETEQEHINAQAPHRNVDGADDGEPHYASKHMDEEDAKKIAKREVEAFVCETELEHINAQSLHRNMDGVEDGESHCDETHVDYDCKVRCALVNLEAADEFGKTEIVAEIDNEDIHARISHHRVDDHYVDDVWFIF